jgi:hypothetical protein
MLLADRYLRDFIDFLSALDTLNLISYKIRDSNLYVSFSIESKSLVLLRYYVLSLRSRFSRETALLSRVRRSVVKHVIYITLISLAS